MSIRVLQRRLLWRFRAPLGPREIRRTERWLATARVALAISSLIAIWVDPAAVRYSVWTYWLLGIYIVHGVVIMLLLRIRQRSTASFRFLVHAADVLWPALISLFTAWQGNPFFLFFVFVLAAAAYRWGLWETMATALASVVLLAIETLAMQFGFAIWLGHFVHRTKLSASVSDLTDLDPKNLFMRSVYLLVLGALLGYLAEQQKRLRAEKAVIAKLLGDVRVENGLTGTLQAIALELVILYGSGEILIASEETNSHRVFVGGITPMPGIPPTFRWMDSSASDRQTYLYDSPADVCFAKKERNGVGFAWEGITPETISLKGSQAETLQTLSAKYSFTRLLVANFTFGKDWSGRIFLLDPFLAGDSEEELHFLQELIRQVGPAIYNVYLLRRLRQRVGAVERARFARELHDGAVQSLIAVEMQVDVLRRQSMNSSDLVTSELGRIQGLLREEVLKLRELMQQMKSMDLDSRKLLGFFADTVERFQRETGISASFHTELGSLEMPPQTCRELAHIVQEGLINIRKHSGARHVLVRFGVHGDSWHLFIEDDGSGFPFSGRLSQRELDNLGKGPMVIKERVRLLEGELTIESEPGTGSRLEISVPRAHEVRYG